MFPGRIRLVVSLSRPIRLNAVVGFFCSSRKLNRPFLMRMRMLRISLSEKFSPGMNIRSIFLNSP